MAAESKNRLLNEAHLNQYAESLVAKAPPPSDEVVDRVIWILRGGTQ